LHMIEVCAMKEQASTGWHKNCYRRNSFWLALFVLISASPLTAQDPAPAAMATGQADGITEPVQRHGSDVVAYWFGPYYRTPFVVKPGSGEAADIQRNSVEYSHVGSWGMVSNFADLMVNMSNMAEPAASGGSGATEAYAILRSNVGLNEATNSK